MKQFIIIKFIFQPIIKLDKLKADEGADTRVLDRVVCIRSSYQVPLGFKGTVVSEFFQFYFINDVIQLIVFYLGISKSNIDTEVVYSVIFDKKFPNSVSFGGSTNRGYKLCRMSFINLSHAIRNGLYKPLSVKKTVNQTHNSEKQVCYFKVKINQLLSLDSLNYLLYNKIFDNNCN